MKSKKYLKGLVYLLSFVLVMAGCDDDDDPPPVENQPPVISGLNDLTLSPGFGTYDLDFANFVSDQEGEIVTYQVSNSDESVITIILDNTVLTITEVGPGSSDIIVTATDGHEDHEVSDTFTVTVQPIVGAADYTGNAAVMLDFNGLGTGSIICMTMPCDDVITIPDFTVEAWDYDWEMPVPVGSLELANDDHLLVINNVDDTWIWTDLNLDGNHDLTGKKFRFDYSFFTAPDLTGTHWDDDEDLSAIDIRIFFVDADWGDGEKASGGIYMFSEMDLTYSADWQAVEIPLSDFSSLWDFPVDPSVIGVIGMEIWGGTSSDPISFRLDNFGIVD